MSNLEQIDVSRASTPVSSRSSTTKKSQVRDVEKRAANDDEPQDQLDSFRKSECHDGEGESAIPEDRKVSGAYHRPAGLELTRLRCS